MSDAHEYADYDDDLECDCMEEEVDILTGAAHCWRCGSRRYLNSEEMSRQLMIEAEFQQTYYAQLQNEN